MTQYHIYIWIIQYIVMCNRIYIYGASIWCYPLFCSPPRNGDLSNLSESSQKRLLEFRKRLEDEALTDAWATWWSGWMWKSIAILAMPKVDVPCCLLTLINEETKPKICQSPRPTFLLNSFWNVLVFEWHDRTADKTHVVFKGGKPGGGNW